ncbi:arginase family protein [Bradyrhizobium lablabi]|nr:arginase family protein [Bradyrhizobium lablabi]
MTGMSLFPGTLNLQLDHYFELPKQRIRLESAAYGGDVSINIVPCRFMGRRAFILCTDPDNMPDRTIVEIASDLNLRSAYGLVDGQIVEVENEPDFKRSDCHDMSSKFDLVDPIQPFMGFRTDGLIRPNEFVALGVPSDVMSTERQGSAEAPRVLREWSNKVGTYSTMKGKLFNRASAGIDLGDLRIRRFRPETTYRLIYDHVAGIVSEGGVPFLIGGDHAISYPAVAAVAAKFPNLLLVQFDSHHDATDPAEWDCEYNHGTWVRNLIQDGSISGNRVIQIGIRDFQWSHSGAAFISKEAVNVFPCSEMTEPRGISRLASLLGKHANAPVYLSLDIDCVDPAFAPGTGEHMVGGFTSREIVGLIDLVVSSPIRLVGTDLVEVVPALDIGGRTCALAAHLAAKVINSKLREGND